MITVLLHLLRLFPFLCGGHRQLALENLALRQQLAVYKRTTTRPKLRGADRLFWVWLARVWAGWRQPLLIVTPETVLRWQRHRFREHWAEPSGRPQVGRPPINAEIVALVRSMAAMNPLWGAPRIHGELLKLGIEVAERTVSRLMPTRRMPPSQTWRTFLANHVRDLVSIDFFTVPTARLRVLFVLVVLAHQRRRVLHFNVTEHPTATWKTSRRRSR
jgi:putative transposase